MLSQNNLLCAGWLLTPAYQRLPHYAPEVEILKYSVNITILNTRDPIYNSVFFREIYSEFKGLVRPQLSPSVHSKLRLHHRAPIIGTALLPRSGSLALPPATSIKWEDRIGACSFLVIHATNICGNISYKPLIELGANSTFPGSFIIPSVFLGVICPKP